MRAMKEIDPSIRNWDDYQRNYEYSLKHPDEFWDAVGRAQLQWRKYWDQVSDCDYRTAKVSWYLGAELNVSENCLDRHLREGRGDHRALIWVGNHLQEERVFTFRELHREVCRTANALEELGIRKGDRIALYLPNVPELAISVLACARIGVIHNVIFGGFSPQSIQTRVNDSQSKLIITANGTYRGEKWIDLKANVDSAIELGCPSVERVIVLNRSSKHTYKSKELDLPWEEFVHSSLSKEHLAPSHSAQDPLFILYTSGSTGKPKGVLHKMGGYLTYATYTFKIVFQPEPEAVYWCTADLGWITGHSYVLYGPLANGITTLMFEGIPTHPDPGRFWQIVDRYQVSIFYSAPTAIRILASAGDQYVKSYSRKTLRTLGSVGEPINPEAWKWYDQVVGESRLPIVDTWWQTETGGIMISPLAGISPTRPGSASLPLPGIEPRLLDESGNVCEGATSGALVIARSWPGQMTEVYGDSERFYQTYFTQYKGYYFTGDGAYRDHEGLYWITGRMDDVIKISGHRLGTAEIESACITHKSVIESAAVGAPDPITGEALYLFVVLKEGISADLGLHQEVISIVRKEIGPLATPKKIFWVPGLPKTRSGKIMRRILKKLAVGDFENLGDTSTLAEPAVVEKIMAAVKLQLV
jgi:acetyl-CoA synthetase